MKKAMKVVAVILLVAGIGLGGFGVWQYYLRETQSLCRVKTAGAMRKLIAARAAAGTPQAKQLTEDANTAVVGAQSECEFARSCKQDGMLLGSGALVSIIISIVLLIVSRRASK
jgi:hypothetical protein